MKTIIVCLLSFLFGLVLGMGLSDRDPSPASLPPTIGIFDRDASRSEPEVPPPRLTMGRSPLQPPPSATEVVPTEGLAPTGESWREYALHLQEAAPQAALSLHLNVSDADVQRWLDRSLMIHGAADLKLALQCMKAEQIKAAWDGEDAFFLAFGAKKAEYTGPAGPANWPARQAFHNQMVVPFLCMEIERLCRHLYGLGVPGQLIERLRQRLEEEK